MKQCRQCRRYLNEDKFQKYSGRNSYYKHCKECAKVNLQITTKYKAGDDSYKELIELIQGVPDAEFTPAIQKIMGVKQEEPLIRHLQSYKSDLKEWLTKDISMYSWKELSELHSNLEDKYAPVIEVLPDGRKVRESTNLDLLDQIFDRFESSCIS